MQLRNFLFFCWMTGWLLLTAAKVHAAAPQGSASSGSPSSSASTSSSSHAHKSAPVTDKETRLDPGSVSHGVYRNATFGLACKIPEGWVLRTEEMNAGDEDTDSPGQKIVPGGCPHNGSCVLLAAFSRPPLANGPEVNSSILIAAESTSNYPGMKEAAQYFGPVTEVAKAQGFDVAEEPYEFPMGTRTLVRGDFQKDVGTRVMLQSTLVMLAKGYAVSLTFIGGTEDEVEALIEGLTFTKGKAVRR